MLLHTVVVMEEDMVEVVMVGTGEEEEVTEDMAAMEEGDMMDTEATVDRAEAEVSQCHGSVQLGKDDDSVTELV